MPEPPRRRWRSSAAVQSRARELRRTLTPAEQTLWQHLRSGQLARYGFRRQYPVGRFIVDFFCPAAKLAIEIDGDSYAQQIDYDAERTRRLEEQKRYRVIRFTNDEVQHHLAAVLDAIVAALKRPPP
jgi:very-short-patch-repair endonuclease